MKILVTGATGFIGHHVVKWLVDHNYEVIATGTDTKKATQYSWFNDVKFIPCDYFKENLDYYEYFEKPDLLIHLAWKGLPNYFDQIHIDNLVASMNLINSFLEHKECKIVVLGTDKEYGLMNGCLSEEIITDPKTMYGLAKDTLRKYLELKTAGTSQNWNWIRLFFVYGEGQSKKSILPLVDAAIENGDTEFPMSQGEQLRDYLPVEKAAEYICKIALQNEYNGIVNCCSGVPISVRRLVEDHLKRENKSIRLKLGVYGYPAYEAMSFWGDNSLLNRITKVDH